MIDRAEAHDAGPWTRGVSLSIALVGVGLVALEYLRNRSLWLDEALLALNVLERSAGELLEPLGYQQGAPAGFLLLQKLAVSAFGDSERALRLLPALAGVIAILGFRRLALACLPAFSAVIAVGLFALSDPILYFATEAKQYAVDIAMTVVLLLLWRRFESCESQTGPALRLALVGAAAVWLSLPSAFVLAGIGAAACVDVFARRDVRRLGLVLGIGAAWATGFAGCWALHLRHLAGNEFLTHFWRRSFLPSPFAFEWMVDSLALPYVGYLALTPLPVLTVALAIVGVGRLAVRDRSFTIIAAVATAALLLASLERVYPAFERLLMFLAPLVILHVAAGAGLLADLAVAGTDGGGRAILMRPVAVALTAVALVWPASQAYALVAQARQVQEIKPVLAFLREHEQPDDVIYVFHLAAYPFKYYAARYGLNDEFALTDYVRPDLRRVYDSGRPRVFSRDGYSELVLGYSSFFTTERPEDVRADLSILSGRPRVWVVLSHSTGGKGVRRMILSRLDEMGQRLLSYRKPGRWGGSEAYLYDLSAQGTTQ